VDVVDVSISGHIGPVLGEDSLAEGLVLDLPSATPSGSFEAEVDPSDTGEEAAERGSFIGHRTTIAMQTPATSPRTMPMAYALSRCAEPIV
jgi:hypothetical protein